MTRSQEPRRRARSAFAAAFLSLVFPGLGHAYARAWYRAVAFAAVPFLLLALALGLAVAYGVDLLGILLQPPVLVGILAGNVVALLYRIVAAVDAYRVVVYLNRWDEGAGRLGPSRTILAPLSLAGLLAVVLVMSGAHVAVAYYDLQALDLVSGVFDGGEDEETPAPVAGATTSPDPGEEPLPSNSPIETAAPGATDAPAATLPPWDGKRRLNVLLIGSDRRPGQGSYNTDTLIVASIDPKTGQVAMFSLPRDTVGVPLPEGPARAVFGPTWNRKINALFQQARARPDLFPGGKRSGYQALKDTLGGLYGLDIQYFVEVDFAGFRKVVDAVGGVTVNVQLPVVDDDYPAGDKKLRVYVPTGVQHMTGAEALIYARSRHGSSDFDRAARQQRVILSLRQQADFATLARPDVLSSLVAATKGALKTDFPVDKVSQLIELGQRIDIGNVRSFVFAPPYYGSEGYVNGSYVLQANVPRIRQAARSAFDFDPRAQAERQAIAEEGAVVWVVSGTGEAARAEDLARYLDYEGFAASMPRGGAPDTLARRTIITAYNGAESRFPLTAARLEELFEATLVVVADPAKAADFVVIQGVRTPVLEVPAGP
jgi:LCP family protein required for cell wall assembly